MLRVEVPHPRGETRERLRIATAAGDVLVTGTRFTVSASGDRATVTMEEGRVRLVSPRGSTEVASPGWGRMQADAAPRAEAPFPPRLDFEFHDVSIPTSPGAMLDSGEEYRADVGHGWIGPKRGDPIPGATWLSRKGPLQIYTGRFTTDEFGLVDPRIRGLSAGWSDHVETWMMNLPDGRYRVTVRVGDPVSDQGPHHVRVQDVQVFDRVFTREGELTERSAEVTVSDGRLTMRVGGGGTGQDGTSDTVLQSLVIEPLDRR
jgi:hypothetical protein